MNKIAFVGFGEVNTPAEIILKKCADAEKFAQNVMCQHYIISYGDNTEKIANLCSILGIEII